MTWGDKKRDLRFDGGLTATDADAVWLEREMRFTNGTGDDIADAVKHSLRFSDDVTEREVSISSDPLELILRAEEEAEEDDM